MATQMYLYLQKQHGLTNSHFYIMDWKTIYLEINQNARLITWLITWPEFLQWRTTLCEANLKKELKVICQRFYFKLRSYSLWFVDRKSHSKNTPCSHSDCSVSGDNVLRIKVSDTMWPHSRLQTSVWKQLWSPFREVLVLVLRSCMDSPKSN